MYVEKSKAATRARLRELRSGGARVALVPTMGALHEGHLALVDRAHELADAVAVSIFVNPLQFGANDDLARYPRTPDADERALRDRGVSLVFMPDVGEMYSDHDAVTIAPPSFASLYEGAVRPGHFAGVLTVVAKLFNIFQPDAAVFGRKDLQQLSLVRAMVRDLDFAVVIEGVATVRERDGLAMSSRNRYLSDSARPRAAALHRALREGVAQFTRGVVEPEAIEAAVTQALAHDPALVIDYVALVERAELLPPDLRCKR